MIIKKSPYLVSSERVRVSVGYLCEADAPTEPADETLAPAITDADGNKTTRN